MKKHMATPQHEWDAFSAIPQGVRVWEDEDPRSYVRTSLMYDDTAADFRTAPRVLAFIAFRQNHYLGQFVSLESALNVGFGMPRDKAESVAKLAATKHAKQA